MFEKPLRNQLVQGSVPKVSRVAVKPVDGRLRRVHFDLIRAIRDHRRYAELGDKWGLVDDAKTCLIHHRKVQREDTFERVERKCRCYCCFSVGILLTGFCRPPRRTELAAPESIAVEKYARV